MWKVTVHHPAGGSTLDIVHILLLLLLLNSSTWKVFVVFLKCDAVQSDKNLLTFKRTYRFHIKGRRLFHPEDGHSRFCRNFHKFIPDMLRWCHKFYSGVSQ
jgi:hypothetical protein